MTISVHQLLHGYRRGHELLASSKRLSAAEEEIVTRLSDLSGSLTTESEFRPYITAFPLPSQGFYALAKTWLDQTAVRAGCVVTHTLLIQMNDWKQCSNPSGFAKLFALPSNVKDLKPYEQCLEFSNISYDQVLHPPHKSASVEFVAKFFGQGLRPIVWFDEERAEDALWLILNGLWPELRAQFSGCTFSLQQRVLENRSFDLMFAPTSAYPRFHNIPRENLLGASASPTTLGTSQNQQESWWGDLAEFLFDVEPTCRAEFPEFDQLKDFLGSDATTIKKLFLFRELRKRATESPTASVGLMDVLTDLAPGEHEAQLVKQRTMASAMDAIATVTDPQEALNCYFLLAERLKRPAFQTISHKSTTELSSRIAVWTARRPDIAIKKAEPLFVFRERAKDLVFARGVVEGLESLGRMSPEMLEALHHSPALASAVIAEHPPIALHYLRGMRTLHSASKAVNDLVAWISPLPSGDTRNQIRNLLIQDIASDIEAPLLEELLRSLPKNQFSTVLETLSQTKRTSGLQRVRRVIAEQLSFTNPKYVQEWAVNTASWGSSASYLVSQTYSKDLDGLKKLLNINLGAAHREALVIAEFIESLPDGHLPSWFKESLKRNPAPLVRLLSQRTDTTKELIRVIEKVLNEVMEMPLSKEEHIISDIGLFEGCPFGLLLVDRVMRSAISDFITGDISFSTHRSWLNTHGAHKWLLSIPDWELKSIVNRHLFGAPPAWERAWIVLTELPRELFERTPSPVLELVKALISPGYPWTTSATPSWIEVLRRAAKEADRSEHLRFCIHALKFAFDNPRFAVGELVVETFWPVYESIAVRKDPPAEATELVGFFWDKGKELRRQLVESFLYSEWAPGDLALAVKDFNLLRKIFKRVIRKYNGEAYIAKMLADLESRNATEANRLHDYIQTLAQNPDFYEAWD